VLENDAIKIINSPEVEKKKSQHKSNSSQDTIRSFEHKFLGAKGVTPALSRAARAAAVLVTSLGQTSSKPSPLAEGCKSWKAAVLLFLVMLRWFVNPFPSL